MCSTLTSAREIGSFLLDLLTSEKLLKVSYDFGHCVLHVYARVQCDVGVSMRMWACIGAAW